MAQISHSAITVIGNSLDQHCYAMRCVTFIHDLFKGRTIFIFTRTTPDGALDILFWHILSASFIYSETQTKVRIGVTTTLASGKYNFTSKTRKDCATLGISRAFFTLDG